MEAGQPPASLAPGDVAVLPQGQAYSLRDSLNTKPVPVTQVVSPRHFHDRGGVRYGGGGAITTFICGGFFFENGEQHRLLSALPPLIVIRNSDPQYAPWLGDLLSAMAHETQTYEPGAQAVINRLAEVLFVQAVRTHMRRLPESEGSWLSALLDPDIGPALGLIHSRPDHAWTVASLADSVAMSRSAFAARFAAIAGNPPLTYLRQHRMQKAAQLLRDYDDTVKTVGSKVGYDSEAAFNNAFRTVHGTTPSHYRTGRRSS
jgi:AraC-like DNA-binding protein